MAEVAEKSTVRWGVLGAARIFERRMAPAFREARNVELVGIASRSVEKAQASAERHQIPRFFGSYDALLADEEIDAVYIPLPNDQHREWTLRAIEAGKHVLCDKPAALTYADALLMADTARAAHLRLMEGFMWRHHPQHARIREIVASGEIGEMTHFRGVFTYSAGPDPDNLNIRWQKAAGGGSLWDVGVYPVNAARYHFDEEPVAVQAVARWDDTYGIDRHVVGILEFSDGRTATVTAGFDQAFTSRYEVVGEKGTITAERGFQVGEKGVQLTIRIGDSDIHTESFPHVNQYVRELEDFSAAVCDPSLSLVPGEDGVAQAAVTEALMRAMVERRRVLLEEITG